MLQSRTYALRCARVKAYAASVLVYRYVDISYQYSISM